MKIQLLVEGIFNLGKDCVSPSVHGTGSIECCQLYTNFVIYLYTNLMPCELLAILLLDSITGK